MTSNVNGATLLLLGVNMRTFNKLAKLTEEDHKNIKKWASEGLGYTEIAKLTGKVSKQRIKQICQKLGIDAHSIGKTKKQQEHAKKMTMRWGDKWNDKEYMRSYVYQAMRAKFRAKKANTLRIGRAWNLDFGDLEFPTHCPILGIELDYFNEEHQANSPSFDCVYPELGYIKGNVFIISMRANRIKNDGSAEEHLAIAKYIQQTPKP